MSSRDYNRVKEHLLESYQLLPESIDGLTSLIEESEDYTCLTLKMILGRRDKGSRSTSILQHNSQSNCGGDICRESGGVA
ncbi:MAG: hypothetical protein QXR02_01350 [Acidilobaceae archaeon]